LELRILKIYKKQNSGNQPEFQSSIKKRTVLKLLLRL